jgi:serine/threonine-protein kinase
MDRKIGRYLIGAELGRGGMGVVYLADDPVLNRKVAIKTVDLGGPSLPNQDFLRQQLLRDARAAAALGHPNVVSVYDVVEDAGTAYLVMEYVEGETLAHLLAGQPPPNADPVLRALGQVASALDYAHSKGVIHRDVKPANIMITAGGNAKLMDFGVARIADSRTIASTGLVVGTVEYMSPEQIKGEAVDGRSDQFALAAVAYQALTGATPFGKHPIVALTYLIVHEPVPSPRSHNPALPAAAEAVLMRGLSKSAEARYATCSEFIDALKQACTVPIELPAPSGKFAIPFADPEPASGRAVLPVAPPSEWVPVMPPSPVPGIEATPRAKKRSQLLVPVAACGVAVVAALGFLTFMKRTPSSADPGIAPKTVAVSETPKTPPPIATSDPPPVKPTTDQAPPPPPPVERTEKTGKTEKARKAETTRASTKPVSTEPERKPVTPVVSTPPVSPPSKPATTEAPETVSEVESQLPQMDEKPGSMPEQIRAAKQHGLELMNAHQFAEAIEVFNKVLATRPLPAAYLDRGTCYLRLKQPQAALRDFDEGLRLNPKFAPGYVRRGQAYTSMEQYDLALRDFSHALELQPNLAGAFLARGLLRMKLDDYQAALGDLNRAVDAAPRMIDAYRARALAEQHLGRHAAAQADRRTAKDLQSQRGQ